MFHLYQKLRNQKASLSYLGVFNDELTATIIRLSEYYFLEKSDLSTLRKKVSFLIAECFQNVVRHGSMEKQVLAETGQKDFYQISIFEDRVVMTTCNLVDNAFKKDIENRIHNINKLSAEELKQLYKEVLSGQGFSSKGGAGLGLIEMARKSGQQLGFYLLPLNGKYSRFFLTIEISKARSKSKPGLSMDVINEIYNTMHAENKLISYKGEFSEEIILPLAEMLKANLDGQGYQKSKEKKVLITLIEMLQNISIHAKKTNASSVGIFSLSKNGDEFLLETGNLLEENKFISLTNSLNKINKTELSDIKPLYREWLNDPKVISGLGMLEIARNTEKNFTYDLKKLPGGEFFYTLRATV
jgi:hypothetical protein